MGLQIVPRDTATASLKANFLMNQMNQQNDMLKAAMDNALREKLVVAEDERAKRAQEAAERLQMMEYGQRNAERVDASVVRKAEADLAYKRSLDLLRQEREVKDTSPEAQLAAEKLKAFQGLSPEQRALVAQGTNQREVDATNAQIEANRIAREEKAAKDAADLARETYTSKATTFDLSPSILAVWDKYYKPAAQLAVRGSIPDLKNIGNEAERKASSTQVVTDYINVISDFVTQNDGKFSRREVVPEVTKATNLLGQRKAALEQRKKELPTYKADRAAYETEIAKIAHEEAIIAQASSQLETALQTMYPPKNVQKQGWFKDFMSSGNLVDSALDQLPVIGGLTGGAIGGILGTPIPVAGNIGGAAVGAGLGTGAGVLLEDILRGRGTNPIDLVGDILLGATGGGGASKAAKWWKNLNKGKRYATANKGKVINLSEKGPIRAEQEAVFERNTKARAAEERWIEEARRRELEQILRMGGK